MARSLFFPPANRTAQWFAGSHPGVVMPDIDRLVKHTTECDGWPDYDGGAKAPGWTALPVRVGGRWQMAWRQHFPANMSDRALVHVLGQPATNTARVAQVELVGTCVRGGPGVYWPAAPDELLAGVADFVRWLHVEWGLPLKAAPLWLPYPTSAGASRARMTIVQWQAFAGICGHQHVPENDHGDPGDLDVTRILELAQTAPPEEDDMTPEQVNQLVEATARRTAELVTGVHGPHPVVVDPGTGAAKLPDGRDVDALPTVVGELQHDLRALAGDVRTLLAQQAQLAQLLELGARRPAQG